MFNPRKEKKAITPGSDRPWMGSVLLIVLIGGAAAAVVAFFVQKKGLAFGLLAGSLLSMLNFRVLYSLSDKVLKMGHQGRKVFWFWTSLRWLVAALLCWVLVRISPACLLGALAGYLWALLVLGWFGWKAAADPSS